VTRKLSEARVAYQAKGIYPQITQITQMMKTIKKGKR